MDREQARQESARLNREHPDRKSHSWLPRERRDGSWDVARISLAAGTPELTAESRAEPRPPMADDPRSAVDRNAGPNVGPI